MFKIGDKVRVVREAANSMETVHFADIGSKGTIQAMMSSVGDGFDDYVVSFENGKYVQLITGSCLELVE